MDGPLSVSWKGTIMSIYCGLKSITDSATQSLRNILGYASK